VEFSASGFQEFAHCPFKHFAHHLLHLLGRPRQEQGITPALAGTIVHAAIAEWEKSEGRADITALFESAFTEHTRGVVLRHAADKVRARMLTDLRNFIGTERQCRQSYLTRPDPRYIERSFNFPLDPPDGPRVAVTGRLDRVETLAASGGEIGLAVDFKYRAPRFT